MDVSSEERQPLDQNEVLGSDAPAALPPVDQANDDGREPSSTVQAPVNNEEKRSTNEEVEEQKSPLTEPPPAPQARTATPPNGGLTAWQQVVGAHLLFFNSW